MILLAVWGNLFDQKKLEPLFYIRIEESTLAWLTQFSHFKSINDFFSIRKMFIRK